MDAPVSQDLTQVFLELQAQNRSVYIFQSDDQMFFYRPMGRSEYKKIATDTRFNDFEKEELVCQVCCLWPEAFDFENCDAGVPSTFSTQILKSSLLDSIEGRTNITNYYRQEMYDLDNQITCIINEAFPQYDIESIEVWDIEKTAKYLSRAEWKLHNFRGMQFLDPQGEFQNVPGKVSDGIKTTEVTEGMAPTDGSVKTKERLTPEKLAELKRKFPEIPWENDTIKQEGKIMEEHFDTLAPALRAGG